MPNLSNYRRELFCRHYLKLGGNQTQAAIKAGYSPASARQTGHVIMSNTDVKRRLEELKAESYDADEVTPELIKKGLLKEALTAEHSRDRKSALDSLARTKGMFTDNVGTGDQPNMAEVLKVLRHTLPEAQIQALAKRFKVELGPASQKQPDIEPESDIRH